MKDLKCGRVCNYSIDDIIGKTINSLIDGGYRFSIMQDEITVDMPEDEPVLEVGGKRICSRG